MTFNISFGADVDGLYLCEVDENENTDKEKKEKITVWLTAKRDLCINAQLWCINN